MARLFAASLAFSCWMLGLLVGWIGGGAIHLLLLTALAIFPWRERDAPAGEDDQRSPPAADQPSSSLRPGGR